MDHEKAGKYARYEFERKFLVPELPSPLRDSPNYGQIEDIYFQGTNLRLRTVTSPEGRVLDRKLTQKYVAETSDLSTTSITTIYLAESEANLLQSLQGSHLRKNRFQLSHEGRVFGIDAFKEPYEGLFIAEIEFTSKSEMRSFEPPFPNWKEVTLDPAYSGGFLASKIRVPNKLALVTTFWRLFSEQQWDQASELLHQDFTAVWPQSRERIVGPNNFINVNRYYPGNHKIEVLHAFAIGDRVLTTVWIEADTSQKVFANSIFEIREGKIWSAEEYWAEPYPAPDWRQQWVSRLD